MCDAAMDIRQLPALLRGTNCELRETAAYAIEDLLRQLEHAHAAVERMHARAHAAERDMAGLVGCCDICAHTMASVEACPCDCEACDLGCPCRNCDDGSDFQWRGPVSEC